MENVFNISMSSMLSQVIPDSSWTTTTANLNPVTLTFKMKVCRACKHGHMEGAGCMDVMQNNAVIFVGCTCKEYVPADNLEYLEWKHIKKLKGLHHEKTISQTDRRTDEHSSD